MMGIHTDSRALRDDYVEETVAISKYDPIQQDMAKKLHNLLKPTMMRLVKAQDAKETGQIVDLDPRQVEQQCFDIYGDTIKAKLLRSHGFLSRDELVALATYKADEHAELKGTNDDGTPKTIVESDRDLPGSSSDDEGTTELDESD